MATVSVSRRPSSPGASARPIVSWKNSRLPGRRERQHVMVGHHRRLVVQPDLRRAGDVPAASTPACAGTTIMKQMSDQIVGE